LKQILFREFLNVANEAKQAINDKLRGIVATYFRCGGVVNDQIKTGLLLSVRVNFFKIGEYLAKLQARAWLSHARCAPGQHMQKDEENVRDNRVRFLLVILPNIRRFYFFSLTDSAMNLS